MRTSGFYWVRFRASGKAYAPEVAYWNGDDWPLSGTHESADDDELEVLSERLEPPKEKP